jgi:carboxylate-amine ligase
MNNLDSTPLSLFEALGIETEYMIVDRQTLSVKPVADQLMQSVAGESVSDIEHEDITWSNELALHVIELKTSYPIPAIHSIGDAFHREIKIANQHLENFGAMLMPTGMHPWMNPLNEARLWPHEYSDIYRKYDQIFGCQGHGWSNLQSTHINLPFANDKEFYKLHQAIRLIMPLIPAVAASTPVVENIYSGAMDRRMQFYRSNSILIPSIAGAIIPEKIKSEREYRTRILKRMYRDIAAWDPDGLLQHEWLNSRGAIARFDRGSIEIRVIDSQECPAADCAIVWLITSAIKQIVKDELYDFDHLARLNLGDLTRIFFDVIVEGDQTIISNLYYLNSLGVDTQSELTAGEVWQQIIERISCNAEETELRTTAKTILDRGCLSRAIVTTYYENGSCGWHTIYRELCTCLQENRLFIPTPVEC